MDLTHISTKLVVINNSVENDLENMANIASTLNMRDLNIISIVMSDSFESKVVQIKSPSNINYIEVGLTPFLEDYLENPDANFWANNKNTLYILRNGSFVDIQDIVTKIQDRAVRVVRGTSQKSHVISPIELRLSCYLMILFNMDYSKLHAQNSFNILTKDRYLS